MIKKVLTYSFLSLIIAFSLLTLSLQVFKIKPYVVISDSMAPTIKRFSLVYIRPIQEDDTLAVGNIVMIKSPGIPVLHRIVEIDESTIITKGDNNEGVDRSIEASDVRGKMLFAIPLIGILFYNIYPLIIIILVIAIISIIRLLKKELKNK